MAAALEWLAAHARKHYDVEIAIVTDSSPDPQAADIRTFLFRAVRELLLNAVKHGGGRGVRIVMEKSPPDRVKIVVADDGPGFDPTMLNRQGIRANTFGLFNIRERVGSFGGELRIESAPGRPTRMALLAPRGLASE